MNVHGVTYDSDEDCFTLEEDFAHHAPSEFVALCLSERAERKRRDREELQDLWREETRRRKRERYFNRAWIKEAKHAHSR